MREIGQHGNVMYCRWIVGNHPPQRRKRSRQSPLWPATSWRVAAPHKCLGAPQAERGQFHTATRLLRVTARIRLTARQAPNRVSAIPTLASPPALPDSLRLYFCSLPQFPSLIKSNPFDFHNRFNYIHLEGSICCRLDNNGEKKVF